VPNWSRKNSEERGGVFSDGMLEKKRRGDPLPGTSKRK